MIKTRIHPAVSRPASAPMRGQRWWTALALLGVMPATACYTSRPVTGAVPVGATVRLDLTDRGRVALSDRIGPSADQVEGVVQVMSDSGYTLRIAAVRYLNGQTNRWSDESLMIPADLVSRATRRDFSRGRTIALGVGIVGAILGVFLGTDLFGGGSETETGVPKGGTGET